MGIEEVTGDVRARTVPDPRRRLGPRGPARSPRRGPAFPIRSRAPVGSTASRSTTSASWSSTGGTTYDWRAQEARLNEFDHFRTRIDGQSIHFVHARSAHADALPLLITHGWPGSIVEFLDVIPRLTDPEAFGGRGRRRLPRGRARRCRATASPSPPARPVGTSSASPRRSSTLMSRLGYSRYGAQGGDWGAQVTTRIGALDPEHCAAIHLNMAARGAARGDRTAHR